MLEKSFHDPKVIPRPQKSSNFKSQTQSHPYKHTFFLHIPFDFVTKEQQHLSLLAPKQAPRVKAMCVRHPLTPQMSKNLRTFSSAQPPCSFNAIVLWNCFRTYSWHFVCCFNECVFRSFMFDEKELEIKLLKFFFLNYFWWFLSSKTFKSTLKMRLKSLVNSNNPTFPYPKINFYAGNFKKYWRSFAAAVFLFILILSIWDDKKWNCSHFFMILILCSFYVVICWGGCRKRNFLWLLGIIGIVMMITMDIWKILEENLRNEIEGGWKRGWWLKLEYMKILRGFKGNFWFIFNS